MSAAPRPIALLRRALERGSLLTAEAAARELPKVPLADALALCTLYAAQAPERYPRAAARWLERAISERRLSIEQAAALGAALQGLPSDAGVEQLNGALRRSGLADCAAALQPPPR